jgi:hypothetical protein
MHMAGDDTQENKSHVLLNNRASYSSIARRQWGSASALRTEVGTGDSVGGAATVESYRRSTGLVTPAAQRVTIGWVLQGHKPRRRGGRPTTQHGSRMSSLVHKGGGGLGEA